MEDCDPSYDRPRPDFVSDTTRHRISEVRPTRPRDRLSVCDDGSAKVVKPAAASRSALDSPPDLTATRTDEPTARNSEGVAEEPDYFTHSEE